MRVACVIQLTEDVQKTLESWSRGRSTAARLVTRARIVLLAAEGWENKAIAERLQTTRPTVGHWRTQFARFGIAGIEKDATRPGRPRTDRSEVERNIITATTQTKPEAATHWSTRMLAKHLGVDHVFVHRVWRANGLQPHRIRSFKLSNDKRFEEKLVDVVGLYLNPPERALVLSADEKSQIQALDRTQPGLPMKRGRCGTMTHDYKRNGTTTLFAAIDMLEGKVISECMDRHRHQEWIKFLEKIDRETPQGLDLHLIIDNYSTHKHPKVQKWLKRHARFHMHFIPTSSSWLNVIERFFRELTQKRIRRGAFNSVEELKHAIFDYIAHHNASPTPFVWTAQADKILEKVGRARLSLDKVSSD